MHVGECRHEFRLDALDDVGVSPELVRIVRERIRIADDAADLLKTNLTAVVQNLAVRLRAAMGGTSQTDRMRAAILSTRLENVIDLLDQAGLSEAEAEFFKPYKRLADLADDGLEAAGVPNASRILDEPAARVAIDATIEDHLQGWENIIERPMASRILSGIAVGGCRRDAGRGGVAHRAGGGPPGERCGHRGQDSHGGVRSGGAGGGGVAGGARRG